jgi:hypothetical protein
MPAIRNPVAVLSVMSKLGSCASADDGYNNSGNHGDSSSPDYLCHQFQLSHADINSASAGHQFAWLFPDMWILSEAWRIPGGLPATEI